MYMICNPIDIVDFTIQIRILSTFLRFMVDLQKVENRQILQSLLFRFTKSIKGASSTIFILHGCSFSLWMCTILQKLITLICIRIILLMPNKILYNLQQKKFASIFHSSQYIFSFPYIHVRHEKFGDINLIHCVETFSHEAKNIFLLLYSLL